PLCQGPPCGKLQRACKIRTYGSVRHSAIGEVDKNATTLLRAPSRRRAQQLQRAESGGVLDAATAIYPDVLPRWLGLATALSGQWNYANDSYRAVVLRAVWRPRARQQMAAPIGRDASREGCASGAPT